MTVYLLLNSDGAIIINSNKRIPMAHLASYGQFATNKTMLVKKLFSPNCGLGKAPFWDMVFQVSLEFFQFH